jgi:hypothetical protein
MDITRLFLQLHIRTSKAGSKTIKTIRPGGKLGWVCPIISNGNIQPLRKQMSHFKTSLDMCDHPGGCAGHQNDSSNPIKPSMGLER